MFDLSKSERKVLLDFAIESAYQAGQLTLEYFGQSPETDWKSDNSPVTVADTEAESLLRHLIEARYPNHGIVGEEYAVREANSGYRWILDPIDGTRSFARGMHIYGVQMALELDGEMLLGVVYFPVLDEMIAAAKGLGATLNGKPCKVSQESDLSQALIFAHNQDIIDRRCPAFAAFQSQAYLSRNWGDCYSFMMVATGRAEIAIDPRMSPWDNGPLLVILEEAGGCFTDWQGQRTIWGTDALATNAHFQEALLNLTRSAQPL